MTERRVLGRGLKALIPETVQEGASGDIQRIPLSQIRSNPNQPRVHFDPEKLESLVQSVRRKGVVQPILVRPKEGSYEIVCGERRFRAAQKANLTEIPVLVRDMEDKEALECSIIENLQRQDLNPIEEAKGYQRLGQEAGLTQEEIADVVGKDRSSVANTLRLLGLPQRIQDELIRGHLTMGHARAILAIAGDAEQIALCERILKVNLSVRETERLSRRRRPQKMARRDPQLIAVEETLQHSLGTKVRLAERRGKGAIVISYYSVQERERLLKRLSNASGE